MLRRRGVEIVYVLILVVLAGGTINTVLEGSRPEFSQALILPTRGAQTVAEAVINAFTILLGTGGLYFVYLSGRPTVRQRTATLYFIVGVATLLITISLGLYLLGTKRF